VALLGTALNTLTPTVLPPTLKPNIAALPW